MLLGTFVGMSHCWLQGNCVRIRTFGTSLVVRYHPHAEITLILTENVVNFTRVVKVILNFLIKIHSIDFSYS